MNTDWTEKYRPKHLSEVFGNDKAVRELLNWAKTWGSGKKAVIIAGDAGIGKTSSALALANDFSWSVVELNASDQRNYEIVKKIATRGAVYETFSDAGEFVSSKQGMRKLIILDEADNLFGREDRGGLRAIVETIKNTRQPIILIVNDYYSLIKRSSALPRLCTTIKFLKIRETTIKRVLNMICKKEGIIAEQKALEEIAKRSNKELRSAINDLQSLCEGRDRLHESDVLALGYRDVKITIFDSLHDMFKTKSCETARKAILNLDESPDYLLLWIDENLPIEYTHESDLVRGYNQLSKADVYFGRVNRRQYYGMWSYANDLMTAGVATSKKKIYHHYTRYRFPEWLKKMSRSKGIRTIRKNILKKIGKMTHTSIENVNQDIFPYFQILFQNNENFAVKMTQDMELESEEIAFILKEDEKSKDVKKILEMALTFEHGKKIEEKPLTKEEKTIIKEEKKVEKKQQRNLFDF